MTTHGSQLLYRAATGLEKALADVDADRITEINAELIRDIWDPEACPVDLLPYLAWAMGCSLWIDDWSETTKRAWIAVQWLFKSTRGTRAGLEMAVDYAGRDVSPHGYKVDAVTTRPQQVFSGPSLTVSEREAWMAQLPQVRAWRVSDSGSAETCKAYLGGHGPSRQSNWRFCLGGADELSGF